MMYYCCCCYSLPLLVALISLLCPFSSAIPPLITYRRTGPQYSLGTKPIHLKINSNNSATILFRKELMPNPSSGRKLQESYPACPIDFSYVSEFSWAAPLCKSNPSTAASGECCRAILSTIGIGLAEYLRETGNFELPDNGTVFSCITGLDSRLAIGDGLVTACLAPIAGNLVQSPNLCSGIETTSNWTTIVGPSAMDTSCHGDLSETAACVQCNNDAIDVLDMLNGSECFYFVSLYGAAVANTYGPTNPDTAKCLLAVQIEPASTNHHHVIIISTSVGATVVLILGIITAFLIWFYRRRKVRQVQRKFIAHNTALLSTMIRPNTGAKWLKYEDIKHATNGFSNANIVGVGGFATVYRGRMPDSTEVAVKKIKNCTPEGDDEFRNEVEAINSVRHKHLVVLRGCCVASNSTDGHQRLLVYDYMPNGSLEEHLFSTKHNLPLSWSQRRNIAIGTAKGIAYLHEGVYPPIIHRDIKTNNILLDANFDAQVADFGLARITEEGITHITTRVAGTKGYLAPEYALYGQITEKSDVYSFGVLLLVLMSGRRALDASASQTLITDWAWAHVKAGRVNEIIDARIREKDRSLVDAMERFVLVGILCAHLLVAFRPTMSQALKMLEGDLEIPLIPDRPLPLDATTLYSKEKDYNCFPLARGISYVHSTGHVVMKPLPIHSKA